MNYLYILGCFDEKLVGFQSILIALGRWQWQEVYRISLFKVVVLLIMKLLKIFKEGENVNGNSMKGKKSSASYANHSI